MKEKVILNADYHKTSYTIKFWKISTFKRQTPQNNYLKVPTNNLVQSIPYGNVSSINAMPSFSKQAKKTLCFFLGSLSFEIERGFFIRSNSIRNRYCLNYCSSVLNNWLFHLWWGFSCDAKCDTKDNEICQRDIGQLQFNKWSHISKFTSMIFI